LDWTETKGPVQGQKASAVLEMDDGSAIELTTLPCAPQQLLPSVFEADLVLVLLRQDDLPLPDRVENGFLRKAKQISIDSL
jgi:hypothetical protein